MAEKGDEKSAVGGEISGSAQGATPKLSSLELAKRMGFDVLYLSPGPGRSAALNVFGALKEKPDAAIDFIENALSRKLSVQQRQAIGKIVAELPADASMAQFAQRVTFWECEQLGIDPKHYDALDHVLEALGAV